MGFAAILTLLSVVLELTFKTDSWSHGIGYSDIYLYLGASLEDLSPEPWLITSCLLLTVAIALSMGVYRAVKFK